MHGLIWSLYPAEEYKRPIEKMSPGHSAITNCGLYDNVVAGDACNQITFVMELHSRTRKHGTPT
jgi:hypothetical protein